jgi:maltose O-acetyltransferase
VAFQRVRAHASVHLQDMVVNSMAASTLTPRLLRWALYRVWGIPIFTRQIAPRCFFGGRRIVIGAGTFVNYGCFFDGLAPIEIGRDCAIGMHARFITSTHRPGSPERRAGTPYGAPIRIGDGCWIGAAAIVLPGVTIGEGCIVGSGAVVTGDCLPHTLHAGNPARKLKDLPGAAIPLEE